MNVSKNKRDKREGHEEGWYKGEYKNLLDASYVPGPVRTEGSYDQ